MREQDRVVGHAVRAMYLYCAMADLAVDNLIGFLVEGKPRTPLNPAVLAAR